MRLAVTRRFDSFSLALVCGLTVILAGAGGVAIFSGILTLTTLLLLFGIGVVLLAAHPLRPAPTPFQNTFAHGAARTAHADETLRAVSGDRDLDSPDRQTFRE